MKHIFLSLGMVLLSFLAIGQKDSITTFKVFGACGMCEDRIEEAAKGRGVSHADWDVSTNLLTVHYDASKTPLKRIKDRILGVGHDLEDRKAPDAVYNKLPDCCLYRDMEKTGHAPVAAAAEVSKETTATIKVYGACEMCKDRIEEAAKGKGVSAATWNLETHMLTLVYDASKTSLTKIEDRILEVGHDVENRKAPDAVYEKLPDCCLYRGMENTTQAAAPTPAIPTIPAIESISEDGKIATARFKVFGACGMCEDRIENAAKMRGVTTADWDVNTGMMTVVYAPDKTSLTKIEDRILEVGHDLAGRKAPDEVYSKLPKCCLYRDMASTGHAQLDWQNDTGAQPIAEDRQVRGVVLRSNAKGEFTPIPAVSVYWLDAEGGTTTNEDGVFTIAPISASNRLVVSHAGLIADTITINEHKMVTVVMEENNSGRLQEVVVTSRRLTSYFNTSSPIRMQTMSEKELFKAACCNLSESFETNPSVDVTFNDAITGNKQIQLLGLSGNYTQLTLENMPGPRGLATPIGLNFIPGPWVESIQLTKGIGSVANGFESISGQINIEIKKPNGDQKLFANAYINDMGKSDLNLNLAGKVSDKWSSALLLHYDFLFNEKIDFNKDGFRDMPAGQQYNVLNRWAYDNAKGLMMQFGAHYLSFDKTGGQLNFDKKQQGSTNIYGLGMAADRMEGFAKIGYVFPQKQYKSIGLQLSAYRHNQENYFGKLQYDALQHNAYANLIYQNIIGSTTHKFRTGLSYVRDNYDEQFGTSSFGRSENVGGAFFEYTYTPHERFDVVAGIRGDYNNLFGFFVSPRLHVRFAPVPNTVFRFSAGRGQRTANVFAENMGLMASNRTWILNDNRLGPNHGLNPEVAWNKGISFDQKFRLFNRNASLNVDFFRNDFSNQTIVDLEDPRLVQIRNLEGKSYANSLQVETNISPARNLELRLSYRYFDVKQDYGDGVTERPFNAAHRGFANLGYERGKWKFDFTANLIGSKRIPSTASNPQGLRLPERSPAYTLMNSQITYTAGKIRPMDFYLGVENLGNYFQKNPVIDAANPFGLHFDASMVWGPVYGRTIYAGWRFILNK